MRMAEILSHRYGGSVILQGQELKRDVGLVSLGICQICILFLCNKKLSMQQHTELVFSMVHSARFERTTFGSASQRSIQLSYECIPGKQTLPRPNYKVHWIIPDRLLL